MKTRHKALLLSLLATASLAISLPAAAERGKHDGQRSERHSHRNDTRDYRRNHDNRGGAQRGSHNRGRHNGYYQRHGKSHYNRGHRDRHWSPPRHGHSRQYYYPRPVYNYAPPRYVYFPHGVYGHDYAYAPGYGSGLSLWLDGIGFSYYERGW